MPHLGESKMKYKNIYKVGSRDVYNVGGRQQDGTVVDAIGNAVVGFYPNSVETLNKQKYARNKEFSEELNKNLKVVHELPFISNSNRECRMPNGELLEIGEE